MIKDHLRGHVFIYILCGNRSDLKIVYCNQHRFHCAPMLQGCHEFDCNSKVDSHLCDTCRLSARHRDTEIDNLVSGIPHKLRHHKHR